MIVVAMVTKMATPNNSEYEKRFETLDIMSDAFELCVGHFHFMLDIFLFNIKTLDSVIKNSHIYAKIRNILTLTQTFGLLDNLTMCWTYVRRFRPKRRT